MSSFVKKKKITRHIKQQAHSKGKNDRNFPWGSPYFEIIDKSFKTTALNIVKEVKENMDQKNPKTKQNKKLKENNVWPKWEYQLSDRNYKKKPNESFGAEKHNSQNKNFTRKVQHHFWVGRRKSQ